MTYDGSTRDGAIEAARSQLLARREELNVRLGRIENDLDETPNPDAEERATEREGDEVLEDLGNAGLLELRKIEAALARIEDGSYGICARCGEEIMPERLAAVPYTPFCRDCA
jgi:RNA polymerase-binding transcription factor DksA